MTHLTESERNDAAVDAILEKCDKVDENALGLLAEAALSVNATQFSLPDHMRCPVELPGDDVAMKPNRVARKPPHEKDVNGMVARAPIKLCQVCLK